MPYLTLNTQSVLEKLSKMIKIIPKKVILPANACFLFNVYRSELFLTAKNDFVQVKTSVTIDSDEEFDFCVPADIFYNTLRLIGEMNVKIAKDDKYPFGITISAGKKKYRIDGENPAYFNLISPPDKSSYMLIDAQIFRDAVTISGKFINPKSHVDVYRGLNIICSEGRAVFYSTDGFSMSRLSFAIDSYSKWSDVVVPVEMVFVIENTLFSSEQLTVSFDSRAAMVESKDFTITSTLIALKYPNCEEVFERNKTGHEIFLDKIEVEQALGVLKLYVSEENIIILDINPKRMILSAENNLKNAKGGQVIDLDEAHRGISPMKTGFNIDFFINALSAITTSKINVMLQEDAKKPAILIPVATDPVIESRFILMPLKIND